MIEMGRSRHCRCTMTVSPPEKSPPGDILPGADFYREKIAGGDFLHELILIKKSPPP